MRQFALLSGGKCQTSSWFTTRKTFYDTPRLLHIEQQKNNNNPDFCRRNLTLMAIASTELTIKVAKRRREVVVVVVGGCRGVNNSARGLDVEAISAQNQHHPARVQSLGASAAASGRAAAHVLHK